MYRASAGEKVAMLTVKKFTVTLFQQNCRLLICDETREAVLIDPGGDTNVIIPGIEKEKVTLKGIWLTHSHIDHCGGVAAIKRKFPVEVWAHPAEKMFRSHVVEICAMYGVEPGDMDACPEPEHEIIGGETLRFGKQAFTVLFTPGHAPGHVVFYCDAEKLLIAGDTLFAGSIGRTDIPGGDHGVLMESIRQQILTLPPETRVLPGHGPDTTVGIERESNPFLTE